MPVTKPQDNRILGNLPLTDFERVAPELELAVLSFKQELAPSGENLAHVYFPTSALVSILHPMEDGRSVEVGSIGRNGMVGLGALLGDCRPEQRFIAQVPGEAFRLRFDVFTREGTAPGVAARVPSSLHGSPSVSAIAMGGVQYPAHGGTAMLPVAGDGARRHWPGPVPAHA